MLLEWQNANDPDGMLKRTIGILLLGVPSQGSPVAPEPGVKQYLLERIGLDRLLSLCGRQVKDMFAGDENTYMFDLERRWERLLNARRSASRSQAPLVYCAYETVPEPILYGISSLTIVRQLYTQTQCSEAQFPIPAYHTALPKPNGPDDDVHSAWLTRSLDNLFQQWAGWSFANFQFLSNDTYKKFADYINGAQQAFQLIADNVENIKPVGGQFEAPNNYALTAKVVTANPLICMESNWPSNNPANIYLRPAGQCR